MHHFSLFVEVGTMCVACISKHITSCLMHLICAGNLEPIGWAKMEALGLLGLFTEPRFGESRHVIVLLTSVYIFTKLRYVMRFLP